MLLYRLVLIVALLACTSHGASGQTFSSSITADYRITRDVTYLTRDGWEGKLDIYQRADVEDAQPTLIFFHGGSPDTGGRETTILNLLAYLEWGWTVVNVEHRQRGITLAPAAVQNSLCALNWVAQNAQRFRFDRFGVTDLVDVVQGPNTKAYGPLWVRGLSEPLAVAKSVSPLTLIQPSVSPTISIHGDADPTVPYSHAVRLHEQLKKVGVVEELVTIPAGAHGSFPRPQNERAFQRIKAFLAGLGIAVQE